MSDLTPAFEIPSAVAAKLRAVRWRDAWMRLVQGVLRTATVLMLAMTVAVFVDWLVVLFEPTGRVLLTLLALAAPAAIFLLECAIPLVARKPLADLALQVDRAVPALEERWATVTELAESRDPPAIRGAAGLVRQVALEAARMSDLVAPARVITPQQIRRRALELLVACAPLLAAVLLSPQATAVLLARFWLPTRPITLTRITAPAGDFVVPRGEPVTLQAELAGRIPSKAFLYLQRADQIDQLTLLPSTGDPPLLQRTIAAVQEPFDYRFRAGDGRTGWHHVTITERPAITGILFRITPPAYSKLPMDQRDNLPVRCRALKGSRLELALQASKPLANLALDRKDAPSWPLVMTSGGWYRIETALDESVSFTVRLVDEHGLTNLAPPSCRIVVYEDQPPQVRIASPAREISLRPDDTVRIKFNARDDLGVATAELVVSTGQESEEKPLRTVDIPLGDQQGSKSVDGTVDLDLRSFDLEHGQVLNYAVRVRDTQNAAAMSHAGIRGDAAGSQPAEMARLDSPELQPDEATATQPAAAAASQPAGQGSPTASAEKAGQASGLPSQAGQSQTAAGQAASQPTAEAAEQLPATRPAFQPRSKLEEQTAATSPSASSGGQCPAGGTSGKKQERQEGDKQADAGTPPPPDDMTRRKLAGGAGCACSNQQRIKVDQWAGSFEGQAIEKLQIAVDAYLERLKTNLAEAEKPTLALRDQVQPGTTWNNAKARQLRTAIDRLADGEKTIAELRTLSTDTPYAFVGLQLHEIVQSHVTPARQELSDAGLFTGDPVRQHSDFEQAALHIAQARKMLGDTIRQYEDLKREQKLKDSMERLAKMHRLFIENMQSLLKLMQGRPWLNPREGRTVEVSDEFLAKLKEHYEKLRALLDELAKSLADDPDLLRRFMARTKLEGITLRDQLTLLAHRQKAIAQNVVAIEAAGPGGVAALQRQLLKQYAARQVELTDDTARLYENTETWIPRSLDRDDEALLASRNLASKTALAAGQLAAALDAGQTDAALQQGEELLRDLRLLQERLTDAGQDNPTHEKLAIFIASRLEEIGRLRHRESNLLEQIRQDRQTRFDRAAAVAQRELAGDTRELGGKLRRVASSLGSLSSDVGLTAQLLADLVDAAIPSDQDAATGQLRDSNVPAARQTETRLVAAFDQAEQLFDDLLTKVEDAVAGQGSPKKTCKLPTLEELLDKLENECRACEKLGAVVRLNVDVNFDWLGDGSGSGSGSGQGSGAGSGQGTGSASDKGTGRGRGKGMDRMAEAMAHGAQAMAREQAEELKKLTEGGPAVAPATDPPAAPPGRDWNILVSRLQDELRQTRDHVPPEQYQQAIDAYFKSIADQATRPSRGE